MKLRLAIAATAVTSAMAPAVLLAAPGAFAVEAPSASPSVASSQEPPLAPHAADKASPSGTKAGPATGTKPSATPTRTTCTGDEPDKKTDENLQTSLAGIPAKIVAGGGTHALKVNVSNHGKAAYKRVDFSFITGVLDSKGRADLKYVAVELKDPETGTWKSIPEGDSVADGGYLGWRGIKPGESVTFDLRLAVAKDAPAGRGFAFSTGDYGDDAGKCAVTGGHKYVEFEILPAGSAEPGTGNEAKPKEAGGKPVPAPTTKPTGGTQLNPQGNLAETGSSTALPAFAVAGAAAVAVGAGAVFLVRRRRTDGPS